MSLTCVWMVCLVCWMVWHDHSCESRKGKKWHGPVKFWMIVHDSPKPHAIQDAVVQVGFNIKAIDAMTTKTKVFRQNTSQSHRFALGHPT